jgi:hypothetical protein
MVFDIRLMHDIRLDVVDSAWRAESPEWTNDVLLPFLLIHDELAAGLHALGAAPMLDVPLDDADRWVYYALSRVVDTLTFPHQPPGDEERFGAVPAVGRDAYRQLIGALGGWWPEVHGFHPFLHEIAAVEEAPDPDEPPSVVSWRWPGFFVGRMLVARAGVTVRAGRHQLRSDVAATSPMHWAWARRSRPSHDLSHGWGHNSQWRTDFRRDYLIDGVLHYNVEARWPRTAEREEPVPDDLIRHRCDVLEATEEQWPWDTYLNEPAPDWLAAAQPT